MNGDSVPYLVRAFLFSAILPHGFERLTVGVAILKKRTEGANVDKQANLSRLEPKWLRRQKISGEMPLKPFCHRESICEHGMHGPHFVIGGQYRPVVCLHFPSTTYNPATYGTTTGPTLQSPNQRGSSMSSVVALELSKPLFLQR